MWEYAGVCAVKLLGLLAIRCPCVGVLGTAIQDDSVEGCMRGTFFLSMHDPDHGRSSLCMNTQPHLAPTGQAVAKRPSLSESVSSLLGRVS